MKKVVLLALVMAVLMVAGCSGGSPGENASVEDIYESIKEQMVNDLKEVGYQDADFEAEELPGYTITDLKGADAEFVLQDLNKDDVEEGYVIRASMMLNSDQIVVLKAASDKIDAVQEALEAELAAQVELWENYLPDQAEKVQNAIITVEGDYIIYITYTDAEAIEDIFIEAM